VPREDESSIYPFGKYIKTQAKNKTDKIEAILAYVENDKICRSRQLLTYFGETDTKNCGICSYCKPVDSNIRKETVKRIYLEIMDFLKTGDRSSRELVAALPYPEAGILKVLQLLMEKEIIGLTPTNTYKLK
jgi:ATP-dependent DNA helicase RecQ